MSNMTRKETLSFTCMILGIMNLLLCIPIYYSISGEVGLTILGAGLAQILVFFTIAMNDIYN